MVPVCLDSAAPFADPVAVVFVFEGHFFENHVAVIFGRQDWGLEAVGAGCEGSW